VIVWRSLLRHRLFRYGLTGGTAALCDLGGFALLLHLSLPIAIAGIGSFAVALLVNYILSARFVFQVRPRLQRLPLFALGALFGLCINMGVTLGLSAWGMAPLVSKCVGIATAFLFNYAINAFAVFAR
jgi:putative flippase GtrA